MEIEIVRITPFSGKNGFKGFCTVKLTDGDQSLTVNGFTIGETKSGKLIGKPPQQKNERDGKYYDIAHLENDFMWKVSDKIVEAYKEQTGGNKESVKESLKKNGLDETIRKTGRVNPWAQE